MNLLGDLGHRSGGAQPGQQTRACLHSSRVLQTMLGQFDQSRKPTTDAKEPRPVLPVGALSQCMSGGVLLSHTVTSAVPSALKGLASGFGMGPGVSPSL